MTRPYWLDLPDRTISRLESDETADVVVVGAGLCGTSAALALAEAGVDVVLVEAEEVASQATGRNAGFILQGTAERYDRARDLMGHERARLIHAWSLTNHDRMAEAIQRYDIDCDYARKGSLQLAGSEPEEQELLRSAELLVEDGFEAETLDEASLPEIYRQAGFRMGVLLPRDGEIHPARFVRGLAEAAKSQGLRVFERSKVTELTAEGAGTVRVRTDSGQISAQAAVVCTNAWTGQLIPWYAETVEPVRGQMLATAPAPKVFEHPVYADHGYDYWRQDRHGRIVLGGWRNLDPESERGYGDVLNDQIQAQMERFLARFEALGPIEVTHRWSGVMGFSQDGLPLIGPAPGISSVVAGAGFTGHGFGFAFLAGQSLAKLVLEGDDEFATDLSVRRLR